MNRCFAVAILLCLLAISVTTCTSAELVINGGFELPKVPSTADYVTYNKGTNFGGWTVLGGSVDVVPTRFFAGADGSQSVDLNGADSGAVFQIITNTPGVQYRLSFAFAGNPCSWCGAPIKEMEVTWGSSVVATVSQDVTGRTTTEMGWRRFSFVVTGTGRDRLAFRSLTAGLAGPALDEVSVVPNDTPEVFTGLDIRKAVQLSFPTVVGKTYQIESADKADSTVWNLLSSPIPGTGSLITFTDPREDPIKIYRVIEK